MYMYVCMCVRFLFNFERRKKFIDFEGMFWRGEMVSLLQIWIFKMYAFWRVSKLHQYFKKNQQTNKQTNHDRVNKMEFLELAANLHILFALFFRFFSLSFGCYFCWG